MRSHGVKNQEVPLVRGVSSHFVPLIEGTLRGTGTRVKLETTNFLSYVHTNSVILRRPEFVRCWFWLSTLDLKRAGIVYSYFLTVPVYKVPRDDPLHLVAYESSFPLPCDQLPPHENSSTSFSSWSSSKGLLQCPQTWSAPCFLDN